MPDPKFDFELFNTLLKRKNLEADPKGASQSYFNHPPLEYPEPDPKGAMSLALAHLSNDMPKEVGLVKGLSPINNGIQTDHLNVVAQASPSGQIQYNPSYVGSDMLYNKQTLAHELTHLRQFKDASIKDMAKNVFQNFTRKHDNRDWEKEAIRNQEIPKERFWDMYLPSEKK